jgi:non-ribosomal peptide synthetase component F
MFPTWLSGAALVLQPDRVPDSLEALAELIEQQRVSVVNLPTAYWHVWAEAVGRNAARVPDCRRSW